MQVAPLFFLLGVLAGPPAEEPGEPLFGFAEALFEEGEYARALVEYRRYVYFTPAGAKAPVAKRRIGDCRFRNGDYAGAAGSYEEAFDSQEERTGVAGELCRALVLSGQGGRLVTGQAAPLPGIPEDVLCHFRSWALFAAKDYAGAVASREACGGGAPGGEIALFREAAEHRSKRPWVGGALSALVPGTGQLYAGRPGDTVIILLTLPLFAGLAWEAERRDANGVCIALSAVGALFYAGNVYGGFSSCGRYNRLWNEAMQERGREILRAGDPSRGPVDDERR